MSRSVLSPVPLGASARLEAPVRLKACHRDSVLVLSRLVEAAEIDAMRAELTRSLPIQPIAAE